MAIEDAPRSNQDESNGDGKGVDRADSRPLRESFMDSWQRLRDRVAESPLAGLLGEQEDDDEVSETTEDVEASPAKTRFKRFRGAFRGLVVPKPDTIEPNEPNNQEPTYEQSVNVSNAAAEEGLLPYDPSVELGTDELPRIVSEDLEPAEEPDVLRIDHHADAASVASEVDITEEAEPVMAESDFTPLETEGSISLHGAEAPDLVQPQPESIQTILERQHRIQTSVQEAAAAQPAGVGAEAVSNVIPNNPENTNNSVAGLVALDVLNYGVARRRDTKKEKASIARDKKIQKDVEHRAKELSKQQEQQKRYQEELDKRTSKLEKQQPDRLPRIRNADFRARGVDTLPVVPNIVDRNTSIKTEHIEVPLPEYRTVDRTIERHIVAAPDIPLPSAERVLHKVEEAAEKDIPIETEYELRHERKGNDTYVTAGGVQQVPMDDASNTAAYMNGPTSSTSRKGSSTSKLKPQDYSTDNYRQAAVTGAWGAVVGIILFIIFIILT